jgi:hypothetical protein
MRTANPAIFMRKGAISSVEKGINVACARPKMMVERTKPINPPPIAHSTLLLPDLKAITPNQAAVATATAHGIEPTKLLFSITLRLYSIPGHLWPLIQPYKNVMLGKGCCHDPDARIGINKRQLRQHL